MVTEKCKLCATDVNVLPQSFKWKGNQVGPYCPTCWRKIKLCDRCGEAHEHQADGRKRGVSRTKYGDYLCTDCRKAMRSDKPKVCTGCGQARMLFITADGRERCRSCYSFNKFYCDICGKWHPVKSNVFLDKINQLRYNSIFKEHVAGVCKTCSVDLLKEVETIEVTECKHCLDLTVDYYLDENTGKKVHICSYCAPNIARCDDCGMYHTVNNYVNIGRVGRNVCNKCRYNYYTCTICGEMHTKASSTLFNQHSRRNSSRICKKCLPKMIECERCGNSHLVDHMKLLGGHRYCSECEGYVAVCSNCKETTEYKVGSSGLCRKCHAVLYKEGVLSNYNWKPKFHTHKVGNSNLLFGIENELNFPNKVNIGRAIGFIHKNWPEKEVYCVHDGSIANGFEVVTHPRNFESIRTTDWSLLFPLEAVQHVSCGMHVHISRNSFTKFHLFKFINFIHDRPNFVRIIGQRVETQFCKKNSDKLTAAVKSSKTSTRYAKINLQNPNTVELRFFANVINQEGLLKNVEFLKALFDFTLESSAKHCSVVRFGNYVKHYKKQFPNLFKFLTGYNLLTLKK